MKKKHIEEIPKDCQLYKDGKNGGVCFQNIECETCSQRYTSKVDKFVKSLVIR